MWAALGMMILGVACLLILWFPFGHQAQDYTLSRQKPNHRHELDTLAGETAFEKPTPANQRLESLRASRHKRDPFLNRAEAEWVRFMDTISLNPPRPQGILQREGERYVMVGGKLLGVGDGIEGFLVEDIGEDYVQFAKQGKPLRVKLELGGGKP